MGREIMETGKVHVWRNNTSGEGPCDREELLGIRNGVWSYDELVEWAKTEDKGLQEMYKRREYVVPKAPDRVAINNLVIGLVEEVLGSSDV